MIVKIEDFPQGKTIKRIVIDILFDEDGTPLTKIKQDYEEKSTLVPPPYEVTSIVNAATEATIELATSLPLANTVVTTSNTEMTSTSSITHAEDSNIPDEMRDIQF